MGAHAMAARTEALIKAGKRRRHADAHGNHEATEGCTRCWCGCKYWENDRCTDCDAPFNPAMDLEGEPRREAEMR